MSSSSNNTSSNGVDRPLVLLVEDEHLITDIVEVSLQDAGFAVVAVGDVAGAMRELENQPERFCGLITDIRMGGGSGWDIARRARELSPNLPVIYVTGDSYSEWTSLGVPNSLLIEKPFAPAQIVVALSSLMNTGQVHPGD